MVTEDIPAPAKEMVTGDFLCFRGNYPSLSPAHFLISLPSKVNLDLSSLLDGDDKKSKNKRGVLPKHATNIMRSWLFQHLMVRKRKRFLLLPYKPNTGLGSLKCTSFESYLVLNFIRT